MTKSVNYFAHKIIKFCGMIRADSESFIKFIVYFGINAKTADCGREAFRPDAEKTAEKK